MDLKQMNGFRWWKILGLTHLGIVFPQRRNFVDKNFHPFLKAASQPSSQCFQSGFLAKSLTWENEIWLAAAVKSWTVVVAATARCSLSLSLSFLPLSLSFSFFSLSFLSLSFLWYTHNFHTRSNGGLIWSTIPWTILQRHQILTIP